MGGRNRGQRLEASGCRGLQQSAIVRPISGLILDEIGNRWEKGDTYRRNQNRVRTLRRNYFCTALVLFLWVVHCS
jgi:hypothetical protein